MLKSILIALWWVVCYAWIAVGVAAHFAFFGYALMLAPPYTRKAVLTVLTVGLLTIVGVARCSVAYNESHGVAPGE